MTPPLSPAPRYPGAMRTRLHLLQESSVVDYLDGESTRRCMSRNAFAEAIFRAALAGDVKNLDAHVDAVQADLKAAEVARGREVAPKGRAALKAKR